MWAELDKENSWRGHQTEFEDWSRPAKQICSDDMHRQGPGHDQKEADKNGGCRHPCTHFTRLHGPVLGCNRSLYHAQRLDVSSVNDTKYGLNDLLGQHGVSKGESLVKVVYVVLAYQRLNVCQAKVDEHPTWDQIYEEHMKDLFSFCKDIMKPGAQRHMFCNGLQFGLRYSNATN